jgi:phage/conjugal plasmid C-4 type zinc finger TraR family protein
MTPEDRAQELELAEYEHNQAKAIMVTPAAPSARECADCGDAIPEARRLSIQGCTRCISCQEDWEKYGK